MFHKLDYSDSFVIESVHSKGYYFKIADRTAFKEFVHDLDYDATALEQRLWTFIERQIRLLTVMVDRLDIARLEDIIHYSEPAIRSVIRNMKNDGDSRSKLTITVDGNRLYAQGEEYFVRIGAVNAVFADLSYKGATLDALAHLKNEDFEECVRAYLVNEFIHDPQYSIGKLAIEYAVQFLWISHVRNGMGHLLRFEEEDIRQIEQYERLNDLAAQIIQTLQQRASYILTGMDAYALALIFICACDFRDVHTMVMDKKNAALCRKVVSFVIDDLNLTAEDKERVEKALGPFFYSFYLRNHFCITRQYIGLTRVKCKLISAVEYSRRLSREIERYSGIAVSDKEIIYLALSLSSIQGLFHESVGQKILISSKYGLMEAKRFAASIKKVYGDYISKIEVVETYEIEGCKNNFDLVLVDDKKSLDTDVDNGNIRVYSEYSRARFLPSDIVYDIRRLKDSFYFMGLVRQDSFVSINANSRDDVYAYVEQLAKHVYEIKEPLREMLAEEDGRLTYECGYRTVLIHVRNAAVRKDQLWLGTLQKPIVWRHRLVQLVIMIFTGEDYRILWQYEYGLRMIMRTSSNTSLLANTPSKKTLQKIFEEGNK